MKATLSAYVGALAVSVLEPAPAAAPARAGSARGRQAPCHAPMPFAGNIARRSRRSTPPPFQSSPCLSHRGGSQTKPARLRGCRGGSSRAKRQQTDCVGDQRRTSGLFCARLEARSKGLSGGSLLLTVTRTAKERRERREKRRLGRRLHISRQRPHSAETCALALPHRHASRGAKSTPGLTPLPHLHLGTGLGSPLPHPHRDRAHLLRLPLFL